VPFQTAVEEERHDREMVVVDLVEQAEAPVQSVFAGLDRRTELGYSLE